MAFKRVLVVDDDPDMAEVIRLILQASGYQIFAAANCAEGLNRVQEVHPDLIILDIKMDHSTERLRGFSQLIRPSAKRYVPSGRIPLLVVTPFHSLTLRCLAVDKDYLQADDYVEKPLEPSTLMQKVEKLLDK